MKVADLGVAARSLGRTLLRSARVLMLGDPDAVGTFEALPAFHSACQAEDCRRASAVDDFASVLEESGWSPDVIIIVQTYPEEFARSAVHRLISLSPLARWIVCLGPWCESVGRTGVAWPLSICVPARSAGPRLRAEWDRLQAGLSPLPLTASRDEAFEHDLPARFTGQGPAAAKRVSFSSPDAGIAGLIDSVCRQCGAVITPPGSDAAVDVHISDVDPLCYEDFEDRRTGQFGFRRSAMGRWIAVTGSPAPNDAARLRAAGALAVIPKLSIVAELPRALRSVAWA